MVGKHIWVISYYLSKCCITSQVGVRGQAERKREMKGVYSCRTSCPRACQGSLKQTIVSNE